MQGEVVRSNAGGAYRRIAVRCSDAALSWFRRVRDESVGDSGSGWFGAAAITALIPGVGWVVRPGDPFFVASGFSWSALSPLLSGLCCGSSSAFVSGAATLAGAFVIASLAPVAAPSPSAGYALSLGVLGLLAGEFRDSWQRALATSRGERDGHAESLRSLTREHRVLERRHRELERRVAGGQPCLRTAFDRIHARLRAAGGLSRDAADAIVGLFRDHGHARVASLHLASAGGVAHEPVAAIGSCPGFDARDPMVLDALNTGLPTAVREPAASSRSLACVPLTDLSGRVRAVVVIHELPFLAMDAQHLALLATLGRCLGDSLAQCGGREAERCAQ